MERFLYMIGLNVIGIDLSLTKRRTYIIKRISMGSLMKMLLLDVASSTDVAIVECGKQIFWMEEAVTPSLVLDFVD